MRYFGRFIALFLTALPVLGAVSCATSLEVTSVPSGATVTVNGNLLGTTPVTAERLEPGRYNLSISKEGYDPWRSSITIERGNNAIQAALVRAEVQTEERVVERVVRETRETLLSVYVDPPGSEVVVDGVSRGFNRSEEEPVQTVFRTDPTHAEILVSHAGYGDWRRVVPIEAGRENKVYVSLVPLPPWYDYPTDAEVMRRTILSVTGRLGDLPGLERTARISVVSMTTTETTDEPLQATIEDALVSELTRAGYTGLERDDHILVDLAHSGVGESLPYRILTGHESPERPFVYDAEVASWRHDEKFVLGNDTGQAYLSLDTTENPIVGYVPTADQLLAYRILECGLSFTPVDDGRPRPEPMFHRRGDVRLHLRVIDARTGEVLWAGYLEGSSDDEIPVRVAPDLANAPVLFYTEPLPDSYQGLENIPERHVNPYERGGPASNPRIR